MCKETGYHQVVTCTDSKNTSMLHLQKQSCTPDMLYAWNSFWNVILFQLLLVFVLVGVGFLFYKRKEQLFAAQQARIAKLVS